MSDFWIGQLFTVLSVVTLLAYWVWQTERRHAERMADIEARAAADELAFESRKRAWDEEDARAGAERESRSAALLAEFPELESADRGVAAPGGG